MKKSILIIYMVAGFGVMGFIVSMNYRTFSGAKEGTYTSKYIKTTAVVKEIYKSDKLIRVRKQTMVPATVSFKTAAGKTVETSVSILKIPYYGTAADSGDEISIYYNPDDPVKALSVYDRINMSGGYLLFIITGIAIAVSAFIAFKRISAAKNTTA